MGTSITGYLTPTQIAQTQANQAAMAATGLSLPPPARPFVFFAAFDGTNNDKNNLPLSGSPYQTNVANLYDQAKVNETGNFVPRYYAGVGAGGKNGGLMQAAFSPTKAVHFAAESALADFAKAASDYLRDNPNATYADLSATAVGFSRGAVTAIVFARLLNERGLVLPDGTVIAPPGVPVYGLAPIDPVKSGINGDLSIPPNVKGDALVVRARYEDREHFEGADYNADTRVVQVDALSNHVGAGGGDDKRGTAASVLEGVTGYLKNMGTAIADVAPENRFDATQPVPIRSEAYQTARNGDVLTHEDGSPVASWPIYRTPDIRETVPIKPVADTHDPRDPHSMDAVNGSDLESDHYAGTGFSVADLPIPDLVSHFTGNQNPGAFGAGQLAGFDVLPFNQNSSFLVNADGDITAEINRLPNGYTQIKDLGGKAVYVSEIDASVLTQDQYSQAQTQALNSAQAAQASQASQAANALGLMNSIIGLQHWDDMSELQRTAVVASIYNAVDKISGNVLPGDLGTAASALGVLNAIDRGDLGGVVYTGLSLVENLTYDAASKMGWVSANMPGGVNFLPGLNLALAVSSGDPMSMLAAAANFIPIYGQFISVALSVFGGAFGDDEPDIPMREGLAHAQWDAAGNTVVITDQDVEGGGPTATGWMNSMVEGLQARLANVHDEAGNSYALVPNLLPAIGFQYDPDGFNLGNGTRGFVYLKWTDESGQTQTRYYDGAGNRSDGTGETLAGDFMQHAAKAIAPVWGVATTLAHYQQGQGIELPGAQAGMPQHAADGIHQTLQAITLALPVEPALQNALIDVDGDSYLERTQWLAANQQMLAIDADGNNQISVNELLSLDGPASLHSLGWLDANGDQMLDNRDPSFPALRWWMDVNADANSAGETQTLAQAGIVALDFGSNPPAIVHADGSRQALTVQLLTADVLGVKYQAVQGGVLQLDEQASGPAVATLHAVNSRTFDGQAAHIRGGAADTDGGEETVDAGNDRLVTTSANTIANQSAQTGTSLAAGDARIRAGALGTAVAGQGAAQTAGTAQVRNNGVVFVPAGAAAAVSVGAQMREAAEDMVRSADAGGLTPLAALAIGAAAMQWPSVAAAGPPVPVTEAVPATAPVAAQPSAAPIDWQTWEGSRPGVALPGSPAPELSQTAIPITWSFTSGPAGATANTASTAPEPPASLEWSTPAITPPAHVTNLTNATNSRPSALAPAPAQASHEGDDDEAQAQAQAQSAAAPLALASISSTLLDYPEVRGEQASSQEDTGLRFLETALLANDSTVNAPARPDELSLRISAVFAAVHGSVSLQTNAQGLVEVVFLPETDYHGPASFDYTVTDQYGLSNNARVSLSISAVNDAPVTQDSQASSTEDVAVYFTQAELLATASDVDTTTDNQHLSVSAITAARHGVAEFMPDGRIRFTPDADYNQSLNGPASFTYSVSDGAGGVTPATVWLSLVAVNDAPRLQGESANALEDQVLRIAPADLLANDFDIDNLHADLRISAVSDAVHGSVALQAQPDGSTRVVFTPEADYHGLASFRYTVTDPDGASSMATAQLMLAAVNDAPVTQDGHVSGTEDMAMYFVQADLLAGASDVDTATDGQHLSISAIVSAQHGVAVLMPDGRIRFTPDADYNQSIGGPASFTYNVSDGAGGITPATVWVALAAVNDAPRLLDESINALEDQVLSIATADLLANDTDVDNLQADLRVSAVSDAVHGSVALQAQPDGSNRVIFTPEANYHGIASFRYTVTDPGGASSIATARIAVAAVNDAPVTQGETASGNEDTALLFTTANLLANDFDADTALDGDALRITRVGLAEHGQVFLQADGTVRFVPDADYNGPARFSYWVGDRDAAGIAAGTGYETVATVDLTILAVNDLPVVTGEAMSSSEDVVLNINPALLLANDRDVDTAATNAEPAQVLSISAVGNAQHGSIALLPDGTLQFTPERNYAGAAGFSYTVSDGHGGLVQGQVALTLAPINDAPDVLGETVTLNEDQIQTLTQAQLLANDSDVDNPYSDLRIVSVENATHGAVSLNPDGTIRYVPDANYFGQSQFTYTVSDGSGGFTVGLASLDIAAVNDAPHLVGEALTLNEDTQARFTPAALLANDADIDNAHTDLVITAFGNASHGSVELVAGEIVFTPDLNYSGAASFTYTVSDGAGGTGQATINMTFNAVNDAPVVNGELVWGKRNVSYTLTQAALLVNDTDVETPASIRVSAIGNVQHGTAVLNADGSVRFTPEAGYAGRGSFEYVVQDPEGASSTATAQIDFSRANLNPTATDDSFTGYEDIPFSITQAQLLANDSDADNAGTDLRVSAVGSASNGTVSLQADGSVRFVPAADFNGAASFSYLVSDGDGGQTWATARLTVQSVNDAPVIDDILYGRPVYGYLPGVVSTQDVAIYDEAQALSLASGGFLYSRTYRSTDGDHEGYWVTVYDYAPVTPTYYRNGHMRPVFVESQDATYQDPNNYEKWMYPGDGTRPVNDPYRQNGYIVAYDPDGNSAAISFAISSGPQHGHTWVNQYTALSASREVDYSVAYLFAVGQTGAWQYYSHRGDPYSGADPFTIAVTDGGGATTYLTINTAHAGSFGPVALDVDGGGVQYLGLDDSRAGFDVDQQGGRERLAWVAAGDALLARDIGGDGIIDRSDEISFTGYLPGARTDLEGLAAFDSNANHMLDRGDNKWHEFGAWTDKNSNGISEAGEFRRLDDIGITQIELQSDQRVRQPAQGVTELGQSRMSWTDGHTSAVGDVVLAVAPEAVAAPAVEPVAPPVPQTPQAMALKMVDLIATITAEWERMREEGPLGPGGALVPGPQNAHEAMAATQAQWEQSAESAMSWHGGSS